MGFIAVQTPFPDLGEVSEIHRESMSQSMSSRAEGDVNDTMLATDFWQRYITYNVVIAG